MKRELAAILDFDATAERGRDVALRLFEGRKTGYTAHWVELFISVGS